MPITRSIGLEWCLQDQPRAMSDLRYLLEWLRELLGSVGVSVRNPWLSALLEKQSKGIMCLTRKALSLAPKD